MQINISLQKGEPLLSRTLLKATIDFDKATPSCQEVTSLIANHMKKDEKLIALRHVYNLFGMKKAEVIAYLYEDENKKQLIEPKKKEKKGKKAKEVPKK